MLDWFEERRTCVTRLAVSQPDKLKPEEVADAAVHLAARHLSNELGCAVAPDDVVLGLVRQLSQEDAETSALEQWLALRHNDALRLLNSIA